jgi:hypothetical protein
MLRPQTAIIFRELQYLRMKLGNLVIDRRIILKLIFEKVDDVDWFQLALENVHWHSFMDTVPIVKAA